MLIRIRKGKEKKVGLGWKPGRGTNPQAFRARAVLPVKPTTRTRRRWWANGWWGDQGENTYSESECVTYSSLHAIHDGPVTPTHKRAAHIVKPIVDPTTLYIEGQQIDGTDIADKESGLSCYAGAEALKRRGMIGEYRWGQDVDEIVHWLKDVGPCLIGKPWWYDDFELASNGLLRMTGGVAGGHQTKMDAVDEQAERIWDKNSWGRQWGTSRALFHPSGGVDRGFYGMTFKQLDTLLHDEGAEVCMFRELPTQDRLVP